MNGLAWAGRSGAVLASALLFACNAGDPSEGEGGSLGGGSVFGDARPSSNTASARKVGVSAVNTAVASCGGGCSADVAAGYARLGEGRMLEAFDAFQCADTPEAAFGAGVARVLSAVENDAGDAVMSELGMPHMPASDLLGPDGLLGRMAARWNGEAQLTVSGGLELQLQTEHVMADDWEIKLGTSVDKQDVTFSIEVVPGWTPGTVISPQYDCANGGVNRGSIPSLSLYVTQGGEELDCSAAFSLPADACVATAGSLHVIAAGNGTGDHVELELIDMPLQCSRYLDASGESTNLTLAHVSGHLSADVVLEVDRSGLHPLLQRETSLPDSVPARASSVGFMNAAAAVAGVIASARCYFDKAAAGSGTVFTLPGAMYGGHDIALGAGDARMLAAASAFSAATLELGTSYELALPLRHAACQIADGEDAPGDCPTSQVFVDEVNTAVRGAVIRHDRLAASERLVALSLDDGEQGVAALDAQSALVRNDVSMPGWDVLLELVHAAQDSLAGQRPDVPHVSPGLMIDLHGFFSSPPDPRAITQPALEYSEQCEDFGGGDIECDRNIEIPKAYLQAFFGRYTDADWDAEDYEWDSSDSIEDGFDEVGSQLRERGLQLGD